MKIARIVGWVVAAAAVALGIASPVLAGEDDNHHPGRGHAGYGCHRACPAPFPSSPGASSPGSPSATTTVTVSAVSSSPAASGSTTGTPLGSGAPATVGGPTLPLTGVPISVLVGAAVIILAAGVGAIRWGRSRGRSTHRPRH